MVITTISFVKTNSFVQSMHFNHNGKTIILTFSVGKSKKVNEAMKSSGTNDGNFPVKISYHERSMVSGES